MQNVGLLLLLPLLPTLLQTYPRQVPLATQRPERVTVTLVGTSWSILLFFTQSETEANHQGRNVDAVKGLSFVHDFCRFD
jgi:hypothetical protein